MDLILQLLLGAVGGNIGGALFKNLSLGTLGNSIVGIIGGGLGSQILTAAMGGAGTGSMAGTLAGSGIGGIVLMAIVGFVKKSMAK